MSHGLATAGSRPALTLLAFVSLLAACRAQVSAPPPPDLSDFEPAVVESFSGRQRRLDGLLQDTGTPASTLAEAFADLGSWYQAQFLSEHAIACYSSAALVDRKNFEWHALEADAALAAGRPEEAYEVLISALSEVADPSALWLELAEAELRTGRVSDAREHFEQALAANRSSVRARLGLGQTELSAENFDEALSVLRGASTLQPGVREIEQALGLAYRGLGRSDRADSHLRRATKARPLDRSVESPWLERVAAASAGAQGHATRGRQARDNGRLDESIVHFRRALEAAPEVPVHHQRLGGVLLRKGDAQEARAVLAAAVDRFPDHLGLTLELAKVDAELGSLDRALDTLLALRMVDPTSIAIAQALEVVYARLGRFGDALNECTSVLVERPDSAELHLRCARWHTVLGNWDRAVAQLEESLVLAPGTSGATVLLSRLLAASPEADLRDGARALTLAERGAAGARSPFTLETLAMALAETGDYEAAIDTQSEALAQAKEFLPSDGRNWMEQRLALYREHRPCRAPLLAEELLATRQTS
jgi:tetratricopeptide (TPR) repeat protein